MQIRIATRKSPLALAQTRAVAGMLRRVDPELDIVEVPLSTEGDERLQAPLASSGGKGLFVKEIEAALMDGRAELAVHSLKDVPNELAPGMEIVCIPKREDPRDVFVSRQETDVMELRAGSHIGTSSLRRACQLFAQRNDLSYGALRGNVGTRLGKLERGEFAAIVLASAGLARLGLEDELHRRGLLATPISVERMLPAVGQAALAIEARADDARLRGLLGRLDDHETRVAVSAERAFLKAIQGNCTTPVAGHARFESPMFVLEGAVFSLDGAHAVRTARSMMCTDPQYLTQDSAAALGKALADEVLQAGGDTLLEASRSESNPYRFLYPAMKQPVK